MKRPVFNASLPVPVSNIRVTGQINTSKGNAKIIPLLRLIFLIYLNQQHKIIFYDPLINIHFMGLFKCRMIVLH